MSNKHDVNVRKSSWLNFQIGLIASLLFAFVKFEVYTTEILEVEPHEQHLIDEPIVWNGNFKVYQEPEAKEQAVIKKSLQSVTPVINPIEFKIVKDNTAVTEETEFKNKVPDTQPLVVKIPTGLETSKPEEPVSRDFT